MVNFSIMNVVCILLHVISRKGHYRIWECPKATILNTDFWVVPAFLLFDSQDCLLVSFSSPGFTPVTMIDPPGWDPGVTEYIHAHVLSELLNSWSPDVRDSLSRTSCALLRVRCRAWLGSVAETVPFISCVDCMKWWWENLCVRDCREGRLSVKCISPTVTI